MGSCLSKKGSPSSSPTTDTVPGRTGSAISSNPKDIAIDANQGHRKVIPAPQQPTEEEAPPPEEAASGFAKKKEVFIIKHRKSHDRAPPESEKVSAAEPDGSSTADIADVAVSHVRAASPARGLKATTKEDEVDAILLQCGRLSHSNSRNSGGRKYSGSKRSYDFDHSNGSDAVPADIPSSDITGDDERQLRRSQGSRSRRRTPSRERDQQRSGSRERAPGSRRVSRSPARRSETNPNPTSSTENNKPGKIVSVPATVSSMAANTAEAAAVRRVTVKRNVNVSGDAAPRTAVPSPRPRSQSPARRQAQQQQPTLSRSSSRKAEHSPLRRNPLSEIDTNKLATCKSTAANKEKPKAEIDDAGAPEKQTPRKLTRSRSSRRTFDNLEFNPLELNPAETTTNPTSSYTALLLEDIQNFHQKNTAPAPTTTPPPFTLPACVTKAHSIYQAVADLNSSISQEDKTTSQASSYYSTNRFEFKSSSKDPFMESAVVADDDLLEPSFHKYVTVKRGSVEGDRDEIESSGSNSFMGGATPIQHKNWDLPSEPNSVDSSDCWTSKSNATSDLGNDGRMRKMKQTASVARGRVQCR